MQPETRRLDELRPHAQQQAVYGDVTDAELAALRADIESRGLQHAVEITPDGMVLDGCQRIRVYRALGRDEIEVLVRHVTTEDEATDVFLRANLLRRQLDPVAKARAIKALAELEHSREGKRLDTNQNGEFRDRLAAQLGGISGRHLNRFLQLLTLPRAVQDAVSRGELPMTRAIAVASLPSSKRKKIAARLAAGESPKEVVNEYLPAARKSTSPDQAESPADRYSMLLDFLAECITDLAEHAEEIVGTAMPSRRAVELLDQTTNFIMHVRNLEFSALLRTSGGASA